MNVATLISGINFTVAISEITIFEAVAKRESSGRWYKNDLGATIYTEIRPVNIIQELADRIATATRRGNEHRIDAVQLAPHKALQYYCKGFLTAEHFASANEGIGFIEIPDVTAGEFKLTIRIVKDSPRELAITDKRGNFLCGPKKGRCRRV